MSAPAIELAADAVLRPAAGDAVEVVEGEALVFIEVPSGRRVPLMTRASGQLVVGLAPSSSGARLLVTGQMGTRVSPMPLGEVLAHRPRLVEEWVHALGEVGRDGRWATKVIAPEAATPLRLAPGEAVVASVDAVQAHDHSIIGWLTVVAGEARLCGERAATIAEGDVAMPMTRGVWLTSGLRCQIALGQPPHDAAGWVSALNLVGRLATEAVCDRDEDAEASSARRRSGADAVSVAETQEGLDLLLGAATGSTAVHGARERGPYPALEAAFATIERAGFTVGDDAHARARSQVESGRDPFAAAAAACGVRARRVTLAPQWWSLEGPPLVATSGDGRFHCLSWTGRSWTILNPVEPSAPGEITSQAIERLTGQAWEFVPALPRGPLGLRDLGRLALTRSGRDLAVIGALSVGLALLSFFTPFILGKVAGAVTRISTREVVTALGVLTLLLLVNVAWRYVRSVALVRIRARSSTLASGAIWDRMIRQRATWHGRLALGDRMTQSTAVSASSAAVPNYMLVDILDVLTVLGALAAVATTGGALLGAVTLMLALQLGVNAWLSHETARRSVTRVTASAHAQGRLLETLRAIGQLKVYGVESRAFKRWAAPQATLTQSDMAVRRIATVQALVTTAWPVVGLIALVVVSSWSNAPFGDFVTAQAALVLCGIALGSTALATSALMTGRAILSTLRPLLNTSPETDADGVELGVLSGDIVVRDVTFRYERDALPVLDGLSLTVSAGESVAIVGASGCGKTTLMRLLLGLEQPEAGEVLIDGTSLATLNLPSFRRQVGSVLQSSALLPGSIRQNVDVGRGLSDAQVWQALGWAAIADEMRASDMGLDTPVAEGDGALSGGQRQRLLLARALAGDPRMLLLDEATSAQDNVTQGLINAHVSSLRLTRVFIAHRLSTVQSADRIVVIDEGRVAQQGTFEELMAQPGHFADLVQRQSL